MNSAERYLEQRLYMNSTAKKLNISDSQLEIVLYLGTQEEPILIENLQKEVTYKSPATLSSSISDLWKDKKLINKKICKENQRKNELDLTDAGKQLYSQLVGILKGEN